MDLEWDENKNAQNIKKHGIDFNNIADTFDTEMLIKRDERENYGEDRFIGIGKIKNIEIVIVWTKRDEKIRIISARQANKKERKSYNDKTNKN
ncbi:MAG: hypothetical protein HW421_2540 [Ignavibacteria bacterium]|nr:hypothetical protein [Ignavibacteria bacterium]